MNTLFVYMFRNPMKPLNEYIAVLALFVIVAGPYYITTSPLLHHNHVKLVRPLNLECVLLRS